MHPRFEFPRPPTGFCWLLFSMAGASLDTVLGYIRIATLALTAALLLHLNI